MLLFWKFPCLSASDVTALSPAHHVTESFLLLLSWTRKSARALRSELNRDQNQDKSNLWTIKYISSLCGIHQNQRAIMPTMERILYSGLCWETSGLSGELARFGLCLNPCAETLKGAPAECSTRMTGGFMAHCLVEKRAIWDTSLNSLFTVV